MCLYREPTMYMPLSSASLPIDVGMDFTTTTRTRSVSGVVVGGRDHLVADGEVCLACCPAEHSSPKSP